MEDICVSKIERAKPKDIPVTKVQKSLAYNIPQFEVAIMSSE